MRFITLLLFSCTAFFSVGQILTPAKWKYSVSNPSPKIGDEIELVFNAAIEKNWYLYSSEFFCEDGPLKTTINFKMNPGYQLVGKLQAINPIAKHDAIFECDIKIFKGTAEFRQKIKILQPELTIQGDYEYQVCSDVDGKCIPFNDEFSFNNINVKGGATQLQNNFPKKDSSQSSGADRQQLATSNQQPVTPSPYPHPPSQSPDTPSLK